MVDPSKGSFGVTKIGNCTITEKPESICDMAKSGSTYVINDALKCRDENKGSLICKVKDVIVNAAYDTKMYEKITRLACDMKYSSFWVDQGGKNVLNYAAGKELLPEAIAMCAAKKPIKDYTHLTKAMKIPGDYKAQEEFKEKLSFTDRLIRAFLMLGKK
jgi:hypothetical protein